jgi:glucose/arabinose dehydrogenase
VTAGPLTRSATVLAVVAVAALAGCTSNASSSTATASNPSTSTPTPSAASTRLVASRLVVPPALAAPPFDDPRDVLTPPGWRVEVWARVGGARLAAWTPEATLLVSLPGAGQVVELTPGTGEAGVSERALVGGLDQPHGLAFDASTLYVAESDAIDAYTYAKGQASGRRVIVDGLPDAKSPELGGHYAHALKSIVVGRDGWLYFSIGSTGNISAEDRNADPQRATIMRVRATGGAPEVYARGVRNGTGLAVDSTGAVWTAVNNRDNVAYPFDRNYNGGGGSDQGRVLQSYVNDHPLEPLARLRSGRDLGWPYCNPDPDVDPGARGTPLTYSNRPFVRDVQTNPDGSKLDCAALPPVEQGLGAHSAPLGLSFVQSPALPAPYRQGALVGVHGSWNREPPRAPEVSFFPWRDGTLGPQQTLLSGFQGADGSRWGRPVMALPGPDGAIYVTDDDAGAIYRMTPPRQ